MQIDTTRKPLMISARFALFFAALSVILLLLFVAFIHLFSTDRYQGYCSDVTLPYARTARLDESPDPARLAICIHRDGTLCIAGEPRTDQEVRDALHVEARLSRNAAGSSDRLMLLAADERAPFKSIKKIVGWCNSRDIRIWRLAFATRPEQEPGAVLRWR